MLPKLCATWVHNWQQHWLVNTCQLQSIFAYGFIIPANIWQHTYTPIHIHTYTGMHPPTATHPHTPCTQLSIQACTYSTQWHIQHRYGLGGCGCRCIYRTYTGYCVVWHFCVNPEVLGSSSWAAYTKLVVNELSSAVWPGLALPIPSSKATACYTMNI